MILSGMTTERAVHILWDTSRIWGLMAWRALKTMGYACRLSKGLEIADGTLLGKPAGYPPAAMLLVPGGSAALKARALGRRGMQAVRAFVAGGGGYLGICGGAGLGLKSRDAGTSLGLCPWSREGYPERLQHLISGHLRAATAKGELSLPVWWPGRFSPRDGSGVEILATCLHPEEDFWLADLPLAAIPPHVIEMWRTVYGADLSARFLENRPLMVGGGFGKGRYVLSYPHLETPDSPQANAWLRELLDELSGGAAPRAAAVSPRKADGKTGADGAPRPVPGWDLDEVPCAWPDAELAGPLVRAMRLTRALFDTGEQHHLCVRRTPWLWGWRSGYPGAPLNYLHTALCTAVSLEPSAETLALWRDTRAEFSRMADTFASGAEDFLLTCRLSEALGPTAPHVIDRKELQERSMAIFGRHMTGGGLLEELLDRTEQLILLSQDRPFHC